MKCIVYIVPPPQNTRGDCSIERALIRNSDNPHLAAMWRGGSLLGVQPNQRKAERFRQLIELQTQLHGCSLLLGPAQRPVRTKPNRSPLQGERNE
jgi:hypothetical protein